jgi:hypothetical protein
MQTKLTVALVKRVTETEPPTKDTSYFDIEVPRLALRVKPPRRPRARWASLYFVRFTGPDGRERRMKVGDPATMTLDDARKAARAKLAVVDQGGDPATARAADRDRWSVATAIEAYCASAEFARHTPKTRAVASAVLRLHVLRLFEHTPIAEFDVPMARQLARAVATDTRHNARGRRLGGDGAARKTLRTLSALLTWCVHEGQLERNVLIGAFRIGGDREREAVLHTADEYRRLFEAMDALVTEGTLRPAARALIVIAALTGMRRWRTAILALATGRSCRTADHAYHEQGGQARPQRGADRNYQPAAARRLCPHRAPDQCVEQ